MKYIFLLILFVVVHNLVISQNDSCPCFNKYEIKYNIDKKSIFIKVPQINIQDSSLIEKNNFSEVFRIIGIQKKRKFYFIYVSDYKNICYMIIAKEKTTKHGIKIKKGKDYRLTLSQYSITEIKKAKAGMINKMNESIHFVYILYTAKELSGLYYMPDLIDVK